MSTTQAPKKRGSPSDFQGRRAEFLEQWSEDYIEASQHKKLSKFWPRIFPQYWINFPWQLTRTEELVGPLFLDKDPEWVAPVAATKEALSEVDDTRKSEVVVTTQKVKYNVF
jgi:hypothetical protein